MSEEIRYYEAVKLAALFGAASLVSNGGTKDNAIANKIFGDGL